MGDPPESRYGDLTRKHLLGLIYYIAAWSLPAATREQGVASRARVVLQDFVAAVTPFIGQIEFVLEEPACVGRERIVIEDFAATFEAGLSHLDLTPDKVPEHWDTSQITGYKKLNKALFSMLEGRDLWAEGLAVADGIRRFRKGVEALEALSKTRILPSTVSQLIRENRALLAKSEAALQEAMLEDALEALDREALDRQQEDGVEQGAVPASPQRASDLSQLGKIRSPADLDACNLAQVPTDMRKTPGEEPEAAPSEEPSSQLPPTGEQET